jgi:hypothetical protein
MLHSLCHRQSIRKSLVPHLRHSIRRQSTNSAPPESSKSTPEHLNITGRPYPRHSCLPSFLRYAQSTGLDPTSTVYSGTYYEYLCSIALRRLGFSLVRTGGRSDAGIDLLGTWSLPHSTEPLKCIVQCKNLKAKAGPNLIRELEGAFVGAPLDWKGEDVVGILCAGKEATKGVRDAVRSARRGIVWANVEDVGEGVGRVRQFFWNQKAGVDGVEVGLRYLPRINEMGKSVVDTEVILTEGGEVWEPNIEAEE